MDELVDTSTWRYAVISVQFAPDRERLVIAYPDEGTLRNLIAASSIVTLGYNSRADALKNIDRCVVTTSCFKQLLKTAVLHTGGFGISGASQIMRNLLYSGLALALVFFYSRNILSSTLRACISF